MIKTKVKQPSSTLSTSNSIEIPKEAYDKIYDDLLIAINTENFSLIKRFLILLRRQPTIITYLPKLTTLLQLANDKLISWCNSLQVDDTIEVYSRIDQKWFEAKITFVDKDKQVYKKIAVNTINTDSHSQKDSDSYGIGGSGSDGNSSSNSAGNSDGNSSNDNRNSTSNSNGDSTSTNYGISYSASNVLGLRVHYLGWGDKFDDYFLIDDKEINPKNTLIGVTASKKSKKKVPTVVVEVVDDSKSIGNGAIPETNGYTRNGYNRRNRASCNGFVGVNRSNSSNSIANTSLLNSNGLATTTLDVNTNDNSTGSAGSVATTTETQTMEEATDLSVVPTVDTIPTKGSKTGKKRKASNAVPDRNEWICSNCGTLDSENGSDLVLCDGPCLRSFHINCLTNEEAKLAKCELYNWFCSECISGQHTCFICKKKGKTQLDHARCSISNCGKFYHRKCLETFGLPHVARQISDTEKEIPIITFTREIPSVSVEAETTEGGDEVNQDNSIDGQYEPATEILSPVSTNQEDGEDEGKRRRRPIKKKAFYDELDFDTPKKGKRAQKKETKVTVKETKTPKSYLPSGDPGVDYEMHVTSTKVETFTFKCPFHYCDTCYDFYHDKESKSLITCMLCPKAYHMNCVEPGSRFNALFLICPLHPNEALPAAESQKFSFEEQLLDSNPNKKRKNGKTEATITSKKKTKAAERSDADLFFEQIVLSDEFPNAKKLMDNHYRLQKHLIEDMNIIPSTFKLIQKNDYDTLPNKDKMYTAHIPEEPCNCTEICDDSCINRILRIECFDKLKKNLVNPNCSGSICRVGSQCTNRALQNRDYAKVKVFQEHAMGKGLKAAENIRCGALVIEYIGEIIDYQEVQRRMSEQVRLSPTDKDFYIMELDSGMYVDGKFKGNLSRFINHSCDPNCELQRWVVAGQRRIAITAIRDIKNGEPLSYDYQFDTSESDIFKCHCGTAICRGTMAPKKKEASKSSKQERQRLIDAGRNKEKDFLMNLSNEGEWKRSYTSNTIPGDALHEVRNGPIRSLLSYGREKHLFLVRNMKKTNNFLRRRNKLLGDEYDG